MEHDRHRGKEKKDKKEKADKHRSSKSHKEDSGHRRERDKVLAPPPPALSCIASGPAVDCNLLGWQAEAGKVAHKDGERRDADQANRFATCIAAALRDLLVCSEGCCSSRLCTPDGKLSFHILLNTCCQ